MGTNYYLIEREPCECCGRPYERLHIGKSSSGWHFSLHGIPERDLMDLQSWANLLDGKRIEDEYGCEVSCEAMLRIITERGRDKPAPWSTRYLNDNWAEPGLNHLLRHKIDGYHCVAHGTGTWDIIVGEFS